MRKLFFLLFLAAVTPVQAIQLGENLYISLPPETVECVNIQLPDDAGVFSPGLVDYQLDSTAVWGDLTQQIVTTDENNTVRVPMCFSSFGRKDGDCSPSYSLSLKAPSVGVARSFSGGICVSKFPDVDFPSPQQTQNQHPMDVLNDNADIFSIAFKNPLAFAEEGEATLTLLVESYASVTLDITAPGLSPSAKTVSLSPANPKTAINFTTTKTGEITITAKIQGCSGAFCSKQAKAEVSLGGIGNLTGFSVFLFPIALDVKNLNPVRYELVINNFGDEALFTVDLILPIGMGSAFQKQIISFEGEKTIEFFVTPQNASTIYELLVLVSSGGNTKQASSILSTNELLTDSLRETELLKQANPSDAGKIQGEFDSWYNSYKSSEYGEELDEYSDFKQSLDQYKKNPSTQKNETEQPLPPPEEEKDNFFMIVIVAVIVIVLAAVIFFALKKSGGGRKQKEKDVEMEERGVE